MLAVTVLLVVAVAAALLPFLDRFWGRSAGWAIAALFAAVTGALLAVSPAVLAGEPLTFAAAWIPDLGVDFRLRLDGLALMFALMVLVIGALVKIYATRYFPEGRQGGFYAVMTLFALAMLGLVMADDMLLLYLFWELTTICSFLLIGREGGQGAAPAVRTLVVTSAGGMCLLTAVALVWIESGTTHLSALLADPSWAQGGTGTAVMLLLIAAACAKSAQFPVHFWLPDAMAASTPVSAYLHAATMVKAGVFLLLRFSPAFAESPLWSSLLITVGLFTALYGAVIAVTRDDLKELLAYSTVSHLGLIIAVIGVGGTDALIAAAVHTLAHALFKAALFMVVGIVDHHAGARTLSEVSGMGRRMPVTAGAAVLAAASLAGIPPMLGFVTKEKIFGAFAHATYPMGTLLLLGGVAVLTSALTVAYAFRFAAAFLGPPRSAAKEPHEAGPAFLAGPVVLAVAGLGFGVGVHALTPLFAQIAVDSSETLSDPELSLWHGVTPQLLMSLTALAVGGALILLRAPVHAALTARRAPVRGTEVFDGAYNALVAVGTRVGSWTATYQPTRHVVAPVAVLIALAVAAVWAPWEPAERVAGSATRDWALLALLAVSVCGSLLARARLVVLGMVSIAGFIVALWFFALGAPQLALTQFLVEVLTTVVAALVLIRMPRDFERAPRPRRVGTGAVAVAGGAVAALAAFWLTGRRGRSEPGQWFLTHAERETGGTNVVSTILVDFRALDTLGELVVLATAGLAVAAVTSTRGVAAAAAGPDRIPAHDGADGGAGASRADGDHVHEAADNTVIPRVFGRIVGPVLGVLSGYLLLRGHSAPGGGFTAGLVAAMGAVLVYLSAPAPERARFRLAYPALIVVGAALPIAVGALGFLHGSFLRPLHTSIEALDYTLSTVLVFELGILLVVVGTVIAALRNLGMPNPGSEVPDPAGRIEEIVHEQTTQRRG